MSKVPKNFHFVFGLKPQQEPFHFVHYLCLASCIAVNQPDAVYFHYRYLPYGEWWERIRPSLQLHQVEENNFIRIYVYKDKIIEKFRYAHWADIVRLEMLLQYGGIYADMDTLFVRPLPTWFYEKPCIMGKEKVEWGEEAARQAEGSLCNAWILAEKNSAFIQLWLQHLYQEFDGSWSRHSTFLPYRLSKQYPSLIHIEPERSFFYFDWTKAGINKIFVDREEDLRDIYSIHLWSHLWWSRHRTDFTFFNHKRLTPHYVAFANTTFATIARDFLPPDLKLSLIRYRAGQLKEVVENILLHLRKQYKQVKLLRI